MIKYNLTCKCKLSFDSWFATSSEYERLKKMGLITCIKCGSKKVSKSIMSPNLKNKSNNLKKTQLINKEINKKLFDFKNFIKKNYKYVGDKFAQEARSIHYDKKTSKGIYGKASIEETNELLEEGIEVSTIPWPQKKDN